MNRKLMSAPDLATKAVYGDVDGKKVIVATIYSSRQLGLEERVDREETGTKTGRRGGVATPAEERKE